MKINRTKTKEIYVGNIGIGGNNPISIQSMTNTKTKDVNATIKQITELANNGVDLVRITVNDQWAVNSLEKIISKSPVPIVADIHFNYLFALKSIEAGISKIRINPGNIGNEDKIKLVLEAAKKKNIPIRIGVNSGSIEKDILDTHGFPTPQALFDSAMKHIKIANKFDFDDLIISVKSSSVLTTIEAYRLLSEKTNYPLHLGVTEAGSVFTGSIKSTVALSILLSEGIGDTIRISLTGDPIKEVETAKELLFALELREKNIELISCPTCGRNEIDIIKIVEEVEPVLNGIHAKNKIIVAIMGCIVNGPGEAKNADIAIACGKNDAFLYIRGIKKKRVLPNDIMNSILEEIYNI